jgi:CRP/FNR family transcriptional regulator, dissimilatory nitrate respiration regulator
VASADTTSLRNAAIAATLRSCQLFFGLPAADLEAIAAFAVLRNVDKDSYLFREGDAAEGFYVVQKGAINVHRVSAAGKEQVIHVFRPGESLAEAALAGEHGYPANGRAVEASAVIVVPKGPIITMLGRRPDLALRMLGSMSQHLRVVVGLVDDLTLKDVETRFLNWLLKRLGRNARGSTVVQLASTKRVLAAELGTSSETLSRTFAKLRDEELIEIRGSAVHVRDVAALENRFRTLLGEA